MAANEPKITKLKPGEGAGDFTPKQGKDNKPGTRRGTPKGQKRTQNPCILEDGSVDPQCKKVYQRSVAGREKLEDYVKRLDSSGANEKDVFMAAVNSLMNRGHGYVGAYLDSKNPNRTYDENQAMKIADAVMSKAGVGNHPGERLTKEDSDTKEKRADKRAAAKESGSVPEPGRKAMPVGQQRKQPGGRGGGAGMPETWAKPGEKNAARPVEKPEQRVQKSRPAPKTDLQRTLDEYKAGKLSKDELAERLRKKIEGEGSRPPSALPVPGSAAAAKKDSAIEKRKEEKVSGPVEEVKPKEVLAPKEETKPEDTPPTEQKIPPPTSEEDTGLKVSNDQITSIFRTKYNQERKNALTRAQAAARKNREIAPQSVELSPDDLEFIAQDTIDELSEQFELDPKQAISAINKKFGLNIPLPEQGPKTTTEQPQEEPEATTEGTPPKRQPLPEEQLGQGRKRQVGGAAKGFTPQAQSEIKNSIRKAKSQGMTAEQVIEAYKQGTLFPSGLVTETSQTNPLEGGSTPQTPPEKPSVPEAESGSLLDEQGRAKDFRGKPRKESTRQIPLRLPGVSSERLKGQADIEKRRIARETKALGKPPTSPRKRGKAPTQPGLFTPSGRPRRFNTAEMSYEEFSQTVRSLIR